MYMMIESGIRGGFCSVSKRHVQANNRYMKDDFDPSKPENYILYVDANNLYGYCMSQPLPYADYKWMSEADLLTTATNILRIPDTAEVGYILEVDLEIPAHLHDKFSDFPLCPEQLSTSMRNSVPKKLIATLHKKIRYVTHYTYLKTVLKQGVKLVKIHRGISFKQADWMREYIDLNTDLRKHSKSAFEISFYKLMVNSCYGKTIEGCRNKREFKLSYKPRLVQRWINRANFKNRILLNERTNLFLIEMGKTKILFDKVIQCGMTVLEVSKKVMANFHYDVMKKMFPGKGDLTLAYTDTDSFIYEVTTNNDLYQILFKNKTHFDFSDYPIAHPCYDVSNRKVLAKFKDEANGRIISEFIGLRPKLYAYVFHDDTDVAYKKAKGVKKSIVKSSLNLNNYIHALYQDKKSFVTQYNIQSLKHKIYTVEQKKVALSSNDDKRHILPNRVDTLPWGYRSIHENEDLILQCNRSLQQYLLPALPSTLPPNCNNVSNNDCNDNDRLEEMEKISDNV
jgi:hypothetical protein